MSVILDQIENTWKEADLLEAYNKLAIQQQEELKEWIEVMKWGMTEDSLNSLAIWTKLTDNDL